MRSRSPGASERTTMKVTPSGVPGRWELPASPRMTVPGSETSILVDEGALEHVDDLLATLLVQSGQFESRVPLDDRHVQIVVETQDLTTASRCRRLPVDVVLGEVTHPGGGLGLQRRHRNISFAPSPV